MKKSKPTPTASCFARKMGNKCSDLLQYVQEYMEKHYVKHLYLACKSIFVILINLILNPLRQVFL